MIIVRVSARSRRGESVKIKVAEKKISNDTSWTRTRRVLLGSSESARDNDSCSPPLSAADRSGSSWIDPKMISPSNGNCNAFQRQSVETPQTDQSRRGRSKNGQRPIVHRPERERGNHNTDADRQERQTTGERVPALRCFRCDRFSGWARPALQSRDR